jgi:hypothetical protein
LRAAKDGGCTFVSHSSRLAETDGASAASGSQPGMTIGNAREGAASLSWVRNYFSILL